MRTIPRMPIPLISILLSGYSSSPQRPELDRSAASSANATLSMFDRLPKSARGDLISVALYAVRQACACGRTMAMIALFVARVGVRSPDHVTTTRAAPSVT
jgi:hypothetical protein